MLDLKQEGFLVNLYEVLWRTWEAGGEAGHRVCWKEARTSRNRAGSVFGALGREFREVLGKSTAIYEQSRQGN